MPLQERLKYTVDPFFFGSGQRRLFGCAFVPERVDANVVLCPPAGHEYVWTHRIFRRLAIRLAEQGLLALRVDYSGTGDSAGDFEDTRLTVWMEDIALAQGTLNARFGTRRTCLVGLRLGATLALLTNLRQQHAGILVLWDPVSDGCRYLEELRERQSGMPYLSGNAVRRGRAAEDQLELLGFLYSSSLVKDIDALNLWRLDRGPGSTILMVDGSAGRGHQPLAAHLTAQGAHIEYQHLPDGEPWSQMNYNKAVIPSRAIEGIVGWLKESTL